MKASIHFGETMADPVNPFAPMPTLEERAAATSERMQHHEKLMNETHDVPRGKSSTSGETRLVVMTRKAFQKYEEMIDPEKGKTYGKLSDEQRAAIKSQLIDPEKPMPNDRILLEVNEAGKVTRAYSASARPAVHKGDVFDKGPGVPPPVAEIDEAPMLITRETIDLRNVDPNNPPKAKPALQNINIEMGDIGKERDDGDRYFTPTRKSMDMFELNKPEPYFPKKTSQQMPPGPERAMAQADQMKKDKLIEQSPASGTIALAERTPERVYAPESIPGGKGGGKFI